jgi:TPR repeat protein
MNLPKAESFETALTWFSVFLRQSFVRLRSWTAGEFKEGRFHYIRSRAEKGDAQYEYQLGLIYEKGEHGLRSDYEAHRWFLRAAFQGVAAAQAKVCEFNREGRGVPRNDAEAFKWCRKAAEQGHPLSQLRLAEMYRDGIGVERNPKEAKKWQDKVSTQKIPLAESAHQQLSAASR